VKFNFKFNNFADAATALSVMENMSPEQQKDFAKSEYGKALMDAAKPLGEAYSEEVKKQSGSKKPK
jgi:hypothetical protein